MLLFTVIELGEGRKRQDIELDAQRATLDEQRNHISILDSALTDAQARVHAMEDEVISYSKNQKHSYANLQFIIISQKYHMQFYARDFIR